jgi:hypothetical protein
MKPTKTELLSARVWLQALQARCHPNDQDCLWWRLAHAIEQIEMATDYLEQDDRNDMPDGIVGELGVQDGN